MSTIKETSNPKMGFAEQEEKRRKKNIHIYIYIYTVHVLQQQKLFLCAELPD